MTETYEGLNFNGLERRGNYRLIGFREDMLYVLDKKDAAAIIYHIIYRWLTEYRPKDVHKEMERRKKAGERPMTQEEVDDMMWVYMSYNDFVKESGGAVGYNTVIRTLDYLINTKKVFKQRPNHDPRFPDYEYTIDKEVVRKLLKALPVFPPFIAKGSKKPSTHLGTVQEDPTQMGTPSDDGSTQTGIPSTQTGTEATHLGTILYPNGGTSQYYTDNTQITSQESTLPALATTPTASADSEDAHALSLSSKPERKTDGYTDRALVCHSLANGQSVHPHTESPTTAGVPPALGGNDPSPAQMVAKEQASPLASGTQRIGHASSTSQSCSLCSEQEDIQPCRECGTRLCFEHRRDFPSEAEPTRILCVTCLQRHNRAMVGRTCTNTELVSAIAPANGKAEPLIASSTTPTSQPAPAKAARKPRAPKPVDDGLQARIERVYAFFDTLGQEVTEDNDYHYRHTKKATEAIVEWLKSNPTEAMLREVYLKLWNTPVDPQSGFDWKQNMSIAAVLRQYDRLSLAIKASRKNGGKASNLHIVTSSSVSSGLRSYSREELLRLPV